MGTYLWFWLVPVLAIVDNISIYLITGQAWGGFGVESVVGPLVFVLVFAPAGYRITVDGAGLRVTGLGAMRFHEAFYAWIWKRASVVPGELQVVELVPQNAFLRFINWPLLFPGKRSRQHFAFGTQSVIRITRRDRKALTLGTRRPEELRAVIHVLGIADRGAISLESPGVA